MMQIATSCPPKDGIFMGYPSSNVMVGVGAGDQRDGRISNSNNSKTIAGGSTKNLIRRTTTGPSRPRMDQDSGFGSRSPTPGSSGDWKDSNQNGGSCSGDVIKGMSIVPPTNNVTGSGSGGNDIKESRSKSTTNNQSGHEKNENNVDCKGGYENSRGYYETNSNSNHSSGSGQYKKYYNNNQQYGYGYNNQRRYYNNNNNYRNYGNRNSKPWTKGGSRSPNSHDDEWKENGESNRSYRSSSSDTTLAQEDASVISLVDSHNKLALDTPEDVKQGEKTIDNVTNQSNQVEDKDDSRKHRHQNYNNHSSGSGQYKRNQQYGSGGYVQRRYNNNYHYNYRNYGNNRKQFQHHNDYYHHHHHHQNHNYSNNNHDGYYNRGGPNRGYPMHSPSSFNNNRRGNGPPLSPSDYEECLPWPAKRGNWPHAHNESFSAHVTHMNGMEKGCYNGNSRQCSPDTSPASTDSNGPFLLTAQHLGPYDYLVGSMNNHQNGANGNFQYPAAFPQTNYFYSYPATHVVGHESTGGILSQPTTLNVLMPIETNCTRSDNCAVSAESDKVADWPDNASDRSGSESVPSSASTRCNTPDEDLSLDELPALTNESGLRLYSDSSALTKNGLSSNGNLCFRPAKRVSLPAFVFPREWFEDFEPEDIITQFSKAGEVKEKPKALTGMCQGNAFDSLSEAIWTKFFMNQQTTETFRKKVELWRDVYRVVRILNFAPDFKHDPRNFPTFGLQVVGSTMSGFGSNTSDVDMCLLMRASEVDQRYEAVDRLQTLCHTLKVLPCVENQELIYAKVPILKFRDANRRLEVDLNCNNFVGIRNTHLLYSYAQMDWRLKPLVLVVKLWAQYHRINDAKNMTISSYSLVLMVIHFLQCGVGEPVLPVLQDMYPEKFNNSNPILSIKIHESIPPWESRNKMGLGELLIEFLDYFSRKFEYTRSAISVRLGGTIPIKTAANYRSVKNDPHQWKYLCVEEPFDRTNTARSVYDRDIFDRIIGIFFSSWQRLQTSKNLDSIFSPLSDADARNISSAVSKAR